MIIQNVVTIVLVVLGLVWLAIGGIGILRFPDFYSRLHPAGKADTFGATLLLIGLAVHQGLSLLTLKVLLIELFILLANPAATHAIGRAAFKTGLKPWTNHSGERR